MTTLRAPKVIRRVRQRLQLSQEALSRVLSATKGAIQHWERGRNNPDLARLLALREICPPGPERKELDALVKQTQAHVAPLPNGPAGKAGAEAKLSRYAHCTRTRAAFGFCAVRTPACSGRWRGLSPH